MGRWIESAVRDASRKHDEQEHGQVILRARMIKENMERLLEELGE